MATNQRIDRMVILIVDDDAEIRKIIIEYLTMSGFKNFLEANDGTEAYVLLNEAFRRIDLVISDWEMPRTSGITLLRALRQHRHRAKIPFIMITSQQSKERLKISRAAQSKVDHYIVKPFRAQTLLEKVWKALGFENFLPEVS